MISTIAEKLIHRLRSLIVPSKGRQKYSIIYCNNRYLLPSFACLFLHYWVARGSWMNQITKVTTACIMLRWYDFSSRINSRSFCSTINWTWYSLRCITMCARWMPQITKATLPWCVRYSYDLFLFIHLQGRFTKGISWQHNSCWIKVNEERWWASCRRIRMIIMLFCSSCFAFSDIEEVAWRK
jgi:hypothetical protein